MIDKANERPTLPVHMRYFGTTVMNTPDGRADADEKKSGSFWTNVLSTTKRPVEVFLLQGES